MLKSTYKPVQAPAPPPLPPGWTEHKAPTGHSYFYNSETKQSTYTRPVATPAFSPSILPQTPQAFPGAYPAQSFQPGPNHHHGPPRESHRGRGNFRGGYAYQDRRRHEPQDRPKHKYAIPGCAPWVLVKTKLGRRFVHNPDTNESFWKFPQDVMKSVVEFDRLEREKRERREKGETSEVEDEDEEAVAAEELAAAEQGPRPSAPPVTQGEENGDSSDEYEEVEVTDEEDEGDDGNPSKRQRIDEQPQDQPVEFNEDDIAYQLAQMGQDYGLDPGEYDHGEDQDLEEGAEGLPLTEDDSKALFRDMLDGYQINPYTIWERVIEEGRIIEDDRYTVLPNMKSRKETWDEWSRDRIQILKEQREKQEKEDPRIPYLAFLQKTATPKLYWPEFKRKYRKEPEMKNTKLSDKDREKYYRDHINRLKLPQSTLKADLSTLLKSIPLAALNRSTALAALPPQVLTDIRYISLQPSTRDPLITAYISTLPPAPEASDLTAEEDEEAAKKRQDRERREKALQEREKRVQEEKRRQRRDLEYGRGRLREEEMELQRAMRVGKEGLRAQLDHMDDQNGRPAAEDGERAA
ncbi:hypothetical protein H2201_002587 [Coniosporium apollinis]|uniref:WW domain-containing protein n=1 Tax=Coniosporium apollinis TaxID=61459 RepID=A0ABQ9P241_9PEZI|nr:hypothetical protein H2201_002587 [Coniosporium apollinis]